jgi:hypothetical protein
MRCTKINQATRKNQITNNNTAGQKCNIRVHTVEGWLLAKPVEPGWRGAVNNLSVGVGS